MLYPNPQSVTFKIAEPDFSRIVDLEDMHVLAFRFVYRRTNKWATTVLTVSDSFVR